MLREAATARSSTAAGALAVPASLHASLMARLDRVPAVKEVAQVAACIGREFAYPLLAAVSPVPRARAGARAGPAGRGRAGLPARRAARRRATPSSTRWCGTPPTRACSRAGGRRCTAPAGHPRGRPRRPGAAGAACAGCRRGRSGGRLVARGGRGRHRSGCVRRGGGASRRGAGAAAGAGRSRDPAAPGGRHRRHARPGLPGAQRLRPRAHRRSLRAADALAQAADEPRLFLLARYGVWAVHHVREEVGPALPVAEHMLDVASSGREPGLG